MKQGLFITFEVLMAPVKQRKLQKIASGMREQGYEVVCTREPGGTKAPLKEFVSWFWMRNWLSAIRQETLLYLAARADHIAQLIKPALQAGKIVLCDRFSDSTFVYQGSGRGVELETLKDLRMTFATSSLHPDLTILLDGEPEELAIRRNARGVVDRFELEGLAFQKDT